MKRREFLTNSAILGATAMFGANLLSGCSQKIAPKNSEIYGTNPNLKIPLITLNNGAKMPQLGYGVFRIDQKDTQKCVEEAISVGYPMIDTAQSYFNEKGVGDGIKASGIKRENIWVTSKLASDYISEDKALWAFDDSMKKLGLDYLDLFLLHQPYNDSYGAWRVLSKLYKQGRIRSIGISNFYDDRIMDFCLNNEIIPAINQIEIHPFHQRNSELAVMREFGVVSEAWSPLAKAGKDVFENPTLKKIAQSHGKSVAQIMLRWSAQRGTIVIPKTTNKARMIENISIFDFELSDNEMAQIAKLDKKESLFFDHRDPKQVRRIYDLMKERRARGGV